MTATLTCAHCGGGLGRGDRFCGHCGAELHTCANCGESLLPQDQLCPECGTPAEHLPLPDPVSVDPFDPESSWTDMVERLRRATLGEFELGQELGRGGMAAVFLAHEISLARKVAIKVMSPGLLLDDGMIDRFRHEAVTIAHLHHPNIVSVYSVRQAEGLHFFVMQYVQGRSLDQVIQRGGALPVPIVQSILFQVGSALTYAHRCRVIHRDIKPANILIDGDGNAVVTDFGIAKAAQTPSRTLSGALVGTPAYMSPEQCRGAEISGASDQYSLGAVAYELLTGTPPFSGSTLTVMQAHVESPPPPIRGLSADCPAEMEAAILRMLAKDPADRWPRIADAMAAFGATPLAEDDPLRGELSHLAAPGGTSSTTADPTPVSPSPGSRPFAAGDHVTGTAVTGISILPPPSGLEVGDSFVLVATVRGREGICLPPNDVAWSCDTPDVLRFASRGGEAIAIGVGSTRLTAHCKGARASIDVEVSPPRADEITIAPLDHGIGVGDEIRLEAVVRDKRGQPITRPVRWQADNASIAAVGPDGELIAIAPGFTRIIAMLDNARASLVIPVIPARVAAIRVADRPATVPVGRSFEVVATPVDRWGSPLPGRRVRWSSSDARVAQPTAEGRVSTLHPGSVVLTASCEGVSESVRVSVAEAAAHPDESDTADAMEQAGRRVKFRKPRRYRRVRMLAAVIGTVLLAGTTWYFGRPRPRTISPARSLPAFDAPGEQIATTGEQAEVASVLVSPPTEAPHSPPLPARKIRRRPDTVAGAAQPAAAPESAAVSIVADSVVAYTTTPVDQPTTASAAPESAPPEPATPTGVVELRIQGARALAVGERLALWTEMTDGKGGTIGGRRGVTWSSSNPTVASVDPISGMVVARAPGSAAITAASEGKYGSVGIQVSPESEPLLERKRVEASVLAGVEQCYAALTSRDVARLAQLYRPATKTDNNNLKNLTNILRKREWSAEVGDRVDGERQIGPAAATTQFGFRLSWKDSFGGRLHSDLVFRAEFVRTGDQWDLSSCRIVGSPKL